MILLECSASADQLRMGPDRQLEVNCNGHAEVEQAYWRDEDQHNGNTEPTEKCASGEEPQRESPIHSLCNGVDSAHLKEHDLDAESGRVTRRHFSFGLEEGELEQSNCHGNGEDRPDCRYGTQESEKNGQSI